MYLQAALFFSNKYILDIFSYQYITVFLFFTVVWYSIMQMSHNSFHQFPINGHLGCCQSFAITNNSGVNNLVHMSFVCEYICKINCQKYNYWVNLCICHFHSYWQVALCQVIVPFAMSESACLPIAVPTQCGIKPLYCCQSDR